MQSVKGFSLIELLIVVAIIGVLSAVAIPAYNNYLVKSRVVELLTVANSYKVKLLDNFFSTESSHQNTYNLSTDLIDYVSVNTVDGFEAKHVIQVVAKMRNSVALGIGLEQPESARDPLTIQLHGVEKGDIIAWSCHVSVEYNKYVPKICQNNDLEAISVG